MQWIREHLKVLVPVAVLGLAVVAYLAFGVFGVHTLFIDDEVDEAAPVFDSGLTAPEATVPASVPLVPDATVPAAAPVVPDTASPVPETVPSVPEVVTLASGEFIPRSHPGSGRATVLNDGSTQRFLRFEDFATDNGPDLNVYLTTTDASADEGTFDDDFVDLGTLTGNIGDQNYEIPAGLDLEVYDTVVVWCVRFGVAFTAADLVAA
ncbi:MAG: DM13 domain-containing protein [Ilumatobacteraceae bacterium]